MIRVTEIHKRYGTLEVLRGVSLEVRRGEVVTIVGASGAGKTTLLQIMGTLSRPDAGRIPGLIGRRPRAEVEQRADELLAMMGLAARRDHKPSQLSGGEQQRVAIARALINSPAVLLADEPSGNLDSRNREEIHRLFFELRDRLGQTVVIVTHDEHLAAMSDRRIVMSDGLIVEQP